MATPSMSLRPGQSLGFMQLGASLYDVCNALRADSRTFRKLDLSYSAQDPLHQPVVVNLPDNGIRLRFDGIDQRLRLIEILDYFCMNFVYKSEDLVPNATAHGKARNPLIYRRVYQLFGPSYPGEFVPPQDGSKSGIYVLSFPGVAFSFPLQTSAWLPKVDHATMLSSSSASAVTSIAIFEGNSWPEARGDLFTRQSTNPRCSALTSRSRESSPDEVEFVKIHGAGKIEVFRRHKPPFWIILSQTTPQDLITELGPPDQICKRPSQNEDTPRKPVGNGTRRTSMPRGSYGSTPSSVSSTNTDTFETDFDDDEDALGLEIAPGSEQYYCYFEHGFDILTGSPTEISPLPPAIASASETGNQRPVATSDTHVTVTRVILHGNIPGSYPFNRHRRSRWSLEHIASSESLNSESNFHDYHSSLLQSFKGVWPEKDMQEGMVIVRSWGGDGDSPSGSAILIGGEMDEDIEEIEGSGWDKDGAGDGGGNASEQWLKNTRLFKFPGLMFEVMHNGAVSALTVY